MTRVVRPIRCDDLDPLYRMAQNTGGGFTNLPADRPTLQQKVERALACFSRDTDAPDNELFLFALEDSASGAVDGTCQIYSSIGANWPFYSYRIGALTQVSKELGQTFRAETLTLCTDLDGATEVGGLFLEPGARAAGAGRLLARARYLFIKMHRPRFAPRTIAELRGALDAAGSSPFWDGLAGRFFGMPFCEADAFNAVHGNQFIADLMPKHPIYTSMLPDSARVQIGVPHQSGQAAMRMLEREGFAFDCYIDIFDGGPTMIAETDRIATIRDAQGSRITQIAELGNGGGDGISHLIATGRLHSFRCCRGLMHVAQHGATLDRAAAIALDVGVGDTIVHVAD
ncbi:arginine N-succinyltransferase [Caenibius tardaugens NBRC 16725]|uniref:Arginine N-succinyltransferase n=1 Tax=Caenibius tardaugens NBRC 16725 TaxID=1219035 RepID=U2YNB7_9SPHN|nr:arginine N-succinyltransferase [Caenibius tardaugens]AZI35665.1 arginine N-succinyltransferase [Caenibius tardaugens NBRC 16725]GAD50047.1 arginine N-succinyltransferase [Caenibius tardaugens NBRC 16725]